MYDFTVFPLFPSTLGVNRITEDLSNLSSIKQLEFYNTEVPGSEQAYRSPDNDLFKNYQKESDIILKYFNAFKNDVLKLQTTNFKISTSWATKCLKNSSSQYHTHKNCAFSGVLYLDAVSKGGELEFDNFGLHPGSFLLNEPTEWNMYNFERFLIQPDKNLVVFFPSYLRHRINRHLQEEPRYSIAFNFVPVGNIGSGDSSVTLLD